MVPAVLTLAVLTLVIEDPPRFVLPKAADLKITTRTSDGRNTQAVTVRLKGPRQRIDRTFDSVPALGGIAQCDLHRSVMLNPEQRIYGTTVIADPSTAKTGYVALGAVITSSHIIEAPQHITIDAIDTGERRSFSGVTARHVVTTTTITSEGQTPPNVATRVQDGWYVDLPPFGCIEPAAGFNAMLSGSFSPEPPPPGGSTVTMLGRAKRGFPLIETDRHTSSEGTWAQTTELVEISGAPLDAAVFEVPDGYRAALPFWGGGFNLWRADTVGNRLALLWESVRGYAYRFWP
jgi:hypothetical protein